MRPAAKSSAPVNDSGESRDDRLATALRKNLKRRKDQARAKKDGENEAETRRKD
jgi:hypothetical protein